MKGAFAVLALVLLFGCISVDYTQKVERSGDSQLSTKIDMSALTSAAAGMNASGSADTDLQFAKACDDAKKQKPELTCTYANGIFTLSGPLKKEEGQYGFSSEKGLTSVRYTFTLEKLPELASGLGGDVAGTAGGQGQEQQLGLRFTDPKAATSAKQIAAMMKVTYVVEMPGSVVSADGAEKIEGGTARFDALKMMEDGKNIVVVSEEADYTNLLYAAAVFIVIAGIFVLFRMRQQGKKLPIPTSMVELRVDPALADYVRKCRSAGYPGEQIKRELLAAGWQEKDVDYALKNIQ